MANPTSPLELQFDLNDINARRALAYALRQRALTDDSTQGGSVNGMVLPSFGRSGSRALNLLTGGRELGAVAGDEQAALASYQRALEDATTNLLELSDPNARHPDVAMGPPNPADGSMSMQRGSDFTPQEEGQRYSRAMTSGVPQELVNAVMQRRIGMHNLDAMFGGAQSNPLRGGSPAPSGGAPGPQANAAAPSGGAGEMGFLPQPGGASPPSATPNATSAPVPASLRSGAAGGSTGSPLQNVSDGQLMVLSAMGDQWQPGVAALAKEELKNRAVTIGHNGEVLRGPNLVGVWKDDIYTDLTTGKSQDFTGDLRAARAGKTKTAEMAAAMPYETVTTKQGGRDVTVFKSQLPGAPQPPQAQPAAQGGAQPSVDVKLAPGTPQSEINEMLADITSGGKVYKPAGAPAAATGTPGTLGVGLNPEEEAVQKGFGAKWVEDKKGYDSAADSSAQSLARTDQMLEDMKNFQPGKLTPLKQWLGEYLLAGGADPAAIDSTLGNISSMQDFTKNAMAAVFDRVKQLGSREAAQVVNMALRAFPSTELTPDGVRMMLRTIRGIDSWVMARQQLSDQWMDEQGRQALDGKTGDGGLRGFESWFNKNKPIKTYIPSMDSIRALSGASPQGGTARTNAQGWPLMVDKAGNRAYVGPNGQVEELPAFGQR